MVRRWVTGVLLMISLDATAQPVPCVQAMDDTPVNIALAGDQISYCWDNGKTRHCYATDLAGGATTRVPAPRSDELPRIVPTTPLPRLVVDEDRARVCRPDGTDCRTFQASGAVDPGLGLGASVNASGTVVALTNGRDIETFNVATGTRLARFKAGPKKQWLCNHGELVGDAVLVHHAECGDAHGQSWLATAKGKKLAAVGGAKPIDAGDAVFVGGTEWAFVSRRGDVVVIQDVKTGKVTRRIAIGAPAAEMVPALVGGARGLVVMFGGARAGDIATIDLARGAVTQRAAKRCP